MSHAAAAPARPAPAAAPAAAPAVESPAPLIQTAERLFIQLVAGAVVIGENSAKLPVDAKSLANMSFELSKAFHEVEVSRRAKVVLTEATFDASMCDFDAWDSAATTAAPAK